MWRRFTARYSVLFDLPADAGSFSFRTVVGNCVTNSERGHQTSLVLGCCHLSGYRSGAVKFSLPPISFLWFFSHDQLQYNNIYTVTPDIERLIQNSDLQKVISHSLSHLQITNVWLSFLIRCCVCNIHMRNQACTACVAIPERDPPMVEDIFRLYAELNQSMTFKTFTRIKKLLDTTSMRSMCTYLSW